MRSRIFSLSRSCIRTSKSNRRPSTNGTSPDRRWIHSNIYNSTRSAIAVQISGSVMNTMVVEGSFSRGWDAGVAVDDDDGG